MLPPRWVVNRVNARKTKAALTSGLLKRPLDLRLEHNRAKRSCQIVTRTRRKVQMVGGSVLSHSVAEIDPPQLVNHDRLPSAVLHRPNETTADGIEGVDRP